MDDADRAPGARAYAGFLRRAAAYLVDSLVMLAPVLAISFALERGSPWTPLLQLAAWWIYKAGLESGPRQATLGKRALGIKVTGVDGGRVSFGRASARFLGMLVSAFLLGIGFLMAAFTRRKQALHDMMASCLVVRADASAEEIAHASGTMPMTFGAWVGAAFVLFIPLLGILAAVAIPAYQDYVIRARTMEAISEAAAWKASAQSAFEDYARNPVSEPVSEQRARSQYVSRVVIRKPERRIEVHLAAARLHTPLVATDAQIRLTYQGPGAWSCTAQGVAPRYLPPACRH